MKGCIQDCVIRRSEVRKAGGMTGCCKVRRAGRA